MENYCSYKREGLEWPGLGFYFNANELHSAASPERAQIILAFILLQGEHLSVAGGEWASAGAGGALCQLWGTAFKQPVPKTIRSHLVSRCKALFTALAGCCLPPEPEAESGQRQSDRPGWQHRYPLHVGSRWGNKCKALSITRTYKLQKVETASP